MPTKARFTLLACLLVFGLSACGGGGGGSAPADSAVKNGLIVDTGDTARPYIYISPEGNTYTYEVDPTSGKPAGLTISTPEGDDFVVSIDGDTGQVDHWTYKGHVVYFTNYRPSKGLVDVALIASNGDTEYFRNIAYKPPGATSNLRLAPGTDMSSGGGTSSQIRLAKTSGWADFFNAFGITMGAAICGADAIVALGGTAALTGAAAVTFPVTTPVVLAAAGVAVLCAGQTSLAIAAMAPETKLVKHTAVGPEVIATHTSIDIVNEIVGYSNNKLFTNSASCIKKILAKDLTALKGCVFAAVDAASVLGSSTLQRVSGSFTAAKALLKDKNAKGVFCCNGPDQIRPLHSGRWEAVVLGGSMPVDYAFDFGDPPGISLSDFYPSSVNPVFDRHSYTSSGDYLIRVSAILDGSITRSGNFPVRVYDNLAVHCCSISGTLLSDGSTFKVGTKITYGLNVSGGRQPYLYEFDFDAGKQAAILGTDVINVQITYEKPGTYSTFVKITDRDGAIVMSQVKLLKVDKQAGGDSGYRDFTASMCPRTYPNGSLNNPEQLTYTGYQRIDYEFSRTAMCSYTSADGQQTPFLAINWRVKALTGSSGIDTCSGKSQDPYWNESNRQASSQTRSVSVRWAGFFTNKTIIEQKTTEVLTDAVNKGIGVACP